MANRKRYALNRNKYSNAISGPVEALEELLKEQAYKPAEKIIGNVANSLPPNTWKDLEEWNENLTKMDYMNHASFLQATMQHANVPEYVQQDILPWSDDPRTLKSWDYELASAMQKGMLGGSAHAGEEDLRGIMEMEGYSKASIDAAVATYKTIENTGDIEQAVVEGLHAYDPKKNPTFEEYTVLQGEFYGVEPKPDKRTNLWSGSVLPQGFREHIARLNRQLHAPAYGKLVDSLIRAGASEEVLRELAQGSGATAFNASGVEPSMGAAMQHVFEGRSILNDSRFSLLDKFAAERARLEYERTGDELAATQAGIEAIREAKNAEPFAQFPSVHDFTQKAFEGYRESLMRGSKTVKEDEYGRYVGPSQEYSPEDFMTVEQNRAQLEANKEKARQRREQLHGQSVPGAPSGTRPQGQDANLQKDLAKVLGDAKAAQSVWQGTVRERTTVPDYEARAKAAMDWLNGMLNGGRKGLPHSQPVSQSTPANQNQIEQKVGRKTGQKTGPSTPELAGLLMDRPTVTRMMSQPAYTNRPNPGAA